MMEWNDEGLENKKKGMSTSSKVLIALIACILLIILLLIMLLMNMKATSFKISSDGVAVSNVSKATLLATIDGTTYVNIEEFAKIVGYEYHKGEYKSAIIEEDKCYVEGSKETASFYLNENKVYKLLVDKQEEAYQEYTVVNANKKINNKMYATLEAIGKAFNVLVAETSNEFRIYTLDYLIGICNTNVKKWGYTEIKEQSFENQKALLYGFLIVKKEGGLYKIIDTNNTKEIVLDRYSSIEFSENTQEFFVTDTSKKVGIINTEGATKIEPLYDSVSVLDKKSNLYLVEQNKKYGVVTGNNISLVYPEYDNIGLNNKNYLILDELIPVCKDKKWGAFNKNGSLVINVEYDELGYSASSIDINGVKEAVQPILAIERANGIVVKKGDKYGLLSITGKELVPIAVDGIYAINGVEDEEKKYFMLYNGEEINLIQRLIKVGLIEEKTSSEEIKNNTQNNNITTNTVNNAIINENSINN